MSWCGKSSPCLGPPLDRHLDCIHLVCHIRLLFLVVVEVAQHQPQVLDSQVASGVLLQDQFQHRAQWATSKHSLSYGHM